MIFLLYGKEPYLLNKHVKVAMKLVDLPELDLREGSVFTEEDADWCKMPSMLGGQKLFVLRIPELTEGQVGPALLKLLGDCPEGTTVYVVASKVDARTKLFKSLQSKEFKKLDEVSFPKFANDFLRPSGKCLSNDGCRELLRRSAYMESDEKNLYDIVSELQKLSLCKEERITEKEVSQYVELTETANVFSIPGLLQKNRYDEAVRTVDVLLGNKTSTPIGILSLVLRGYRLSYKRALFPASRYTREQLGIRGPEPAKMSANNACSAIHILNDAVEGIKSGRFDGTTAVRVAFAEICCQKK